MSENNRYEQRRQKRLRNPKVLEGYTSIKNNEQCASAKLENDVIHRCANLANPANELPGDDETESAFLCDKCYARYIKQKRGTMKILRHRREKPEENHDESN